MKFNKEFGSIQPNFLDLADYAVQVRYPFHYDVSENDAEKALIDAQKVKEFVMERI